MRILSRYFVSRFLGLFTTALVAAFLILGTIELVLNLDDLSEFAAARADANGEAGSADGPGVATALRYLWIRLASYYLADLLPVAGFLACFVTFAWAGRAMELVATQAGGVRLSRVIAPVLACALILSLASSILHETLILEAKQSWAREARGDRDDIEFRRRSFWYHKGRTITNIDHADPETRTLHGVEIYERGADGRVVRVVRSKRIRIGSDGIWHIEDASIWRFDPARTGSVPELEEGVSMALDLESLRGDALLGADPALLELPALASYLEKAPRETASSRRRLASLYHERSSSPWLLLLFSWLALPFALRVDERGRFGLPATLGIASIATFFLMRSAGTTLAREAILPIGVTPWLAIGIFGLAGGVLLLWRRR